MSVSLRYQPEWAPGETTTIGMEFANIVPPGVTLIGGSLAISTNNANPVPSADFTVGPVKIRGRSVLYAMVSGGVRGQDYQLTFTAEDNQGNIWPRTALMLCAPTS